jgi:hypothetical protein
MSDRHKIQWKPPVTGGNDVGTIYGSTEARGDLVVSVKKEPNLDLWHWKVLTNNGHSQSEWLAKRQAETAYRLINQQVENVTVYYCSNDDGESDWQALYINGNLVTQNHRIPATDVLLAIQRANEERVIRFDYRKLTFTDFDLEQMGGKFPQYWSDIKGGRVV